jgi:hypothetical protein
MYVMEEPCGYPHIEGKVPLELIMLLDFAPFHHSFSLKSTSRIIIYLYLLRAKSIAWVLKVVETTHALCFHVLFFFSKEDLGLLDMYVQVILFSNKGFEFNSIHDLGFPSLDLTLPLNICIQIPTPIAT